MAFDLLFKRKSDRDWGRSSQLTTAPTAAVAPSPTAVTEADVKSLITPGGFTIRPRGRGAVVTKKVTF
jgi:hypothetical protein